MTKRNLIFITLIALLLAACTAMPVAEQTQEIDLANLPADIDVDTVAAIKDLDNVVVIDVREQEEYDEKHIPGVVLIPLGTVPDRLDEIPTDQTVVLTCRSGNRSNQAAEFLREKGYTNVHNMLGGINEWQAADYPVE
jgi:phage shock protein E